MLCFQEVISSIECFRVAINSITRILWLPQFYLYMSMSMSVSVSSFEFPSFSFRFYILHNKWNIKFADINLKKKNAHSADGKSMHKLLLLLLLLLMISRISISDMKHLMLMTVLVLIQCCHFGFYHYSFIVSFIDYIFSFSSSSSLRCVFLSKAKKKGLEQQMYLIRNSVEQTTFIECPINKSETAT